MRYFRNERKRTWSGILAIVLVLSTVLSLFVPTKTMAANFKGKNIWTGGSEVMFGKSRNYLYRWSDGYQMTFCIDPGDHMGSEVVSSAGRYNINDENVPYISSQEDFARLALICDWFDTRAGSISASNASYAAAQAAVWAVMAGEWENADSIVSQVNQHVSGTAARWQELKAYVNDTDSNTSKLPSWCSTSELAAPDIRMSVVDGVYKVDLDIQSFPEIASAAWTFPDSSWSKTVSGDTLTITYSGQGEPNAILSAPAPASMNGIAKNSETLTIYIPQREGDQAMIGAGLKPTANKIYLKLSGTTFPGTPETDIPFEIYEHNETFEAHYNIDLTKFDAETGKTLEGSIFEVLEAFDSSQLNLVKSSRMTPKPATWPGFRSDGQMMTDANGYASHSDVRYYDYSRTYCGGHPEPQYLEVPEPIPDPVTGEITNADEIAATEAENARLMEEWEGIIEACESETDFHSVDEGEGLEMMLEDRDATYEEFIHLKYDYTVKEIEAKYGYILHGKHNDDGKIPVIRMNSSEAGAGNWEIPAEVTITPESISWNTFLEPKQPGKFLKMPVPQPIIYALDESRLITVREESLPEDLPAETEKDEELPDEEESEPESQATPANAKKSGKKRVFVKTTLSEGIDEGFLIGPEQTGESTEEEPSDSMEESEEESMTESAEESAEESEPESEETESESQEAEPEPSESGSEPIEEVPEETAEANSKESAEAVQDEELQKESALDYQYTLLDRFYGDVPQPSLSDADAASPSAPYRAEGRSTLPPPQEDDVDWIDPWGNADKVGYHFQVSDHRTEGEIHINKRDLELYNEDPDGSYGKVQGDATLEGAVYGLYAARDIEHPDGKSGVVYRQDELVALATTDKNGDASFMAYTEESETSQMVPNLDGRWVGHPLILGSYYVKEMSRSEGYELSVYGMDLEDSNRLGKVTATGQVGSVFATTLWHPIDMHDGSWNEFTVTAQGAVNGYEIQISGYPEGASVYQSELVEKTTTEKVVIGSIQKETGEYEKAEPGEKKLDSQGNYIPVLDGEGKPVYDENTPVAETLFAYYRLNAYPNGTAEPEDPEKWADTGAPDLDYVMAETNSMLRQTGFRMLEETQGGGAPWSVIELKGSTNRELAESILDWFAENNFWDCAAVHRVYEEDGSYKAGIFHDYQAVKAPAVYDAMNGVVYLRKEITVDGGHPDSHVFLPYPQGTFTMNGSHVTVSPAKAVTGEVPFLGNVEKFLEIRYQPLYETYAEGEYRLDTSGNKIPIYETEFIYGNEEQTVTEYELTPVASSYDEKKGIYTVHVDPDKDWEKRQETTYRIVTKEKEIVVDGEEMYYNDYLIHVHGAGVSAWPTVREADTSYIRYQSLSYPGQLQVSQDGGTGKQPVQVLERVIKQPIKVTKDVSQDSYEKNNTYRIHKDPFTVLFGGYHGAGKKYVPGFQFKVYRLSELEEAAELPKKEDGTYDLKAFFEDKNQETIWTDLALDWDRPEYDVDRDPTTMHANLGGGTEAFYGTSVMLPYGTYVVVEQVPEELVNRHYEIAPPKVVVLPFVPDIGDDGTIGTWPSTDYLYFADYTPEELAEKFGIRFNEETDVIQAHNHDGDFEIYKYGLDQDVKPDPYGNPVIAQRYKWESTSENAGEQDQVYYEVLYDKDGNAVDYGVTRDDVPTMTGISCAVDGMYAPALVPWSVLEETSGEDGNRGPGLEPDGGFNFISFAKTHFENTFYSSKLRIEKVDAETGENIIHGGALFRIYAVSRDVEGKGSDQVTGTGNVIFKTTPVAGTRAELEARGDVDNITWNPDKKTYEGTVTEPDYSRLELITMLDETGAETGIFKAFSTEREVIKEDGTLSKEKVGYIQTYQPLGAGTYVLVEIQAPPGYVKSKPIAIEVYKDKVTYYPDGDPANQTEAERFQYAVPSADKERKKEDVSQVVVKDRPSSLFIHKVEDGDHVVGDQNGLDGLNGVNDPGDRLSYIVRGRKEYLESRGDVKDITWDEANREYVGTVTKSYQEWSEELIEGTEAELLAMDKVKPLYDIKTGDFSGFGIRFGISVREAELSLYQGLVVKKTGDGIYEGITVEKEDGKVKRITASETGTHLKITTNEKDHKPPYYNIWDAEELDNDPVSVFFYDLEQVETETDETTGELWVLDERGNRICLADPHSGMAYVYDDYGNLIVYTADEQGEKVLAKSIEIHEDGEKEHIYIDLDAKEDELGFPLYYEDGKVTYREEVWITDGTPHEIRRLPFGAYVLEETGVPYDQGYIRSPHMGLVLRESSEDQHFYMQDDFTKANFAKIDAGTRQEIQDAGMTLYEAVRVPDDSGKGYHLEKGNVYAEWISGYQYDDNGSLKLIWNGEKVATTEPHWIDHIPAGDYILEETRVPYEWGYVKSRPMEITIRESGEVQTFVMEDDYTAVEIRKYDTETGEVLDQEHQAVLSLYPAKLDENGVPEFKQYKDMEGTKVPVFEEQKKIVTWTTGSGEDVAATGRLVTDEYGNTTMVYDYDIQYVDPTPQIRQARYFITENGATRFEYLPVGFYVLAEESTPEGYATALPQLIEVRDAGGLQKVQTFEMGDVPLTLEVSKTGVSGGSRQVHGASLAIYPVIDGVKGTDPVEQWISGTDGTYTEEDAENGTIPLGFEVGDLRLHQIRYLPAGEYVLVEEKTPFGFLRAKDICFTVLDEGKVQGVEMVDELPEGILEIVKHDIDHPEQLLAGAVFTLTNKDTGELLQTLTTGDDGKAVSDPVPAGYLDAEGHYVPYTYVVQEISAPEDYMLNSGIYEFQFTYEDDQTPVIRLTYDAVNKQNQVRFKKQDDGGNYLAGAKLKVVRKDNGGLVEEWISGGQDHYITGIKAGEYTLIEVETPGDGYSLALDIDFTVGENMTEPVYIEMTDPSSRVEIGKVISGTTTPLPGAKLQLWKIVNHEEKSGKTVERKMEQSNSDRILIAEWMSEETPKVFLGLEPGIYIIHEVKAPDGYQKGEDLEIEVKKTGKIQIFFFENRKKHREFPPGTPTSEIPGIPPETSQKIGRITVSYHPGERGWAGRFSWDDLPGLGDFSEIAKKMGLSMEWLVGLTVIGLLFGLAAARYASSEKRRFQEKKKRKKSRREKRNFFLLFLLLAASFSMESYALPEESVAEERKRMEWISEPYTSQEKVPVPDRLFQDGNGTLYELENWEIRERIIEGETRQVEKIVAYEQVEPGTVLPDKVLITYQDQNSGYEQKDYYPVLEKVWDQEQWLNDFSMTVTFHEYGADRYVLKADQVELGETILELPAHQETLLAMAGLSPTDYQIEKLRWSTESYADDQGILCRDALAFGKRRVQDCYVTYGGTIKLPDQVIYEAAAVYREKMEESIEETVEETPLTEPETIEVQQEPKVEGIWKIIRKVLVITITASSLILIAAVLFLIIWRKKQKKRKER